MHVSRRFSLSCRAASSAERHRVHGGALVEYTIVALFLILVLIASPDAVPRLMSALRDAYTSFVYALSISWF